MQYRAGVILATVVLTLAAVAAIGVPSVPRAAGAASSSWQYQPTFPSSLSPSLNGLACPTVLDCVAVGTTLTSGDVGAASFTRDGGTTWTNSTLPSGSPTLASVFCSTADDCLAVGGVFSGNGQIYSSSDGGASWTDLSSLPVLTVDGITCTDALDCIVVGDGAFVTTDGGVTWSTATVPDAGSPGMTPRVTAVRCSGPLTCFAVGGLYYTGQAGESIAGPAFVWASDDGGSTWINQPIPTGELGLFAIACPGAAHCVAAGNSGIIRTVDGGTTWTAVTPVSPNFSYLTVSCPSDNICIAGGKAQTVTVEPYWPPSGVILGSTDGGATWNVQQIAGAVGQGVTTVESLECRSVSICISLGWISADGVALIGPGAVAPALALTTTSLPGAVQGAPYSTSVAATGGEASYQWSISSGSLPPGLVLDPGTGVISGTPTAPGSSPFVLAVTDGLGATATASLTMSVSPAPLVITESATPTATVGSAIEIPLTATGGSGPYTWRISAGRLPLGLRLDGRSGMISGSPTRRAVTSTVGITAMATTIGRPRVRYSGTTRLTITIGPTR